MGIVVQKFGGTSVADEECIKNVAQIIKSELDAGNHVIVVVSAMAGVTNSLISKCSALSKLDEDSNIREYDAAIASGEVLTAALLALQLQNINIKAKSLQGWQIPFRTNNVHGNARVLEVGAKNLLQLLDDGIIPIITGFQGINDNGDVTTLGKGGSDTSAAIIAAATNANRCDIYTDVDGIYSADPRIVHNAQKIDNINIDELYELCAYGAKVLHPRAALASKRYGFQMRILSSFSGNAGTNIQTNRTDTARANMENKIVTAITSNKNLLKIDIEANASNFSSIISSFIKEFIPIEQMQNLSQNFGDGKFSIITNLIDKNKCQNLLERLKNNSILTKYELNTNISTVTLVGYGIKNDSNLLSKIIEILENNNINILALNLSDIKISILINDQDNEKVIKLLHEYCFDLIN